MPGRVSSGKERYSGGMGTDKGHGHREVSLEEKHNDMVVDRLVETRRLATQCPTPPTDPFPDFDTSTSMAPIISTLRNDLRYEIDTDGDMTDHTSLPLPDNDDPSSDGGPLLSQTESFVKPQLEHRTGVTPKTRTSSSTRRPSQETIRKLSASQMRALTSSPGSLPMAVVTTPHRKPNGTEYPLSAGAADNMSNISMAKQLQNGIDLAMRDGDDCVRSAEAANHVRRTAADFQRPPPSSRTLSTPPINRIPPSGGPMTAPLPNRRNSFNPLPKPTPLNLNEPYKSSQATTKPTPAKTASRPGSSPPSPMLPAIPLPPMSLPTHLQLELAGQRPSPLYIHHSQPADTPYESSAVKFERLLNALLLPPYLEQVMYFGTLACLDAWLYTFTILPMRFLSALGVLVRWWLYVIWKEARWMVSFVWQGIGRLWRRGRRGRTPSCERADSNQIPSDAERSQSRARTGESSSKSQQNGATRHRKTSDVPGPSLGEQARPSPNGVFHPPKHAMPRPGHFRHRRTKSSPSSLTSYHKADLLQGAILICSAVALMNLDASRSYHFIRGQSSMKLYVIYNILEVGSH
jgi:hypothetical protein